MVPFTTVRHKEEKKRIEELTNPQHYQEGGIETIDIIEKFKLGFHLGNALKYILRAGKKNSKKDDLHKAIWYLKRELKNI